MVRLRLWQWIVLGLPIAAIVAFLLIAAGLQIQHWGISWIWAVVGVVFVGWRWLLVRWTQPALMQMQAMVAEVTAEVEAETKALTPSNPNSTNPNSTNPNSIQQAEAALQKILESARPDPPLWENWETFWQRCQEVMEAIAHVYYPQVKRPLLNIYVPQAYGLLRGTVDDLDQWMQKLAPVLNQVTIGQAVDAYEVYQKLEPSVRKMLRVWNLAQWLLNPAAAVARQATQRTSSQANQQLLANLGQLLREAALRNLGRQAIALYSSTPASATAGLAEAPPPPRLQAQTQTLREILQQATPVTTVEQQPVNILLVGRTGAGKSSLINTLFVQPKAAVDVLPSTDRLQDYHWQADTGETLTLWDSPGYEQVNRADLRSEVLEHAQEADLVLLVTPALDPALRMDIDFLKDLQNQGTEVPTIALVTQVDRVRPIREWSPPYHWETGDRPKEKAIREATTYRAEMLGDRCRLVLPIVTSDPTSNRAAWNLDALSVALLDTIVPAKQLRLARFLRNQEARAIAATKIIDHYTFQMATTQGLTSLLKSPILSFLSTLTTGSPTLAYLLAEKIPVEQLPIVIGKLQMAYELYSLLGADQEKPREFELLTLWPLLLENPAAPDRMAWAFGHALTEYWTQNLTVEQLRSRLQDYLNR